jgi:ABC-type Zn uptake system ZnuABC Zn-binding protein ZnuA
MFARLIEEQPENREMYVQQLEEAKKRIETAKRKEAENMRRQD